MRISDIPWEMVQQELYSWNRPLSLETVRLLDELFFSLEDTGERGDLILVFGSRRGFRYRGRQALRLYQAGRAPHILVSGGTRDPALPTEASLFRQGFREHGVPDEVILTEEMSRTTPENVANTAAMLRRRYGKTPLILLLVTAEFHMTRAYLTAKKRFPGFLPAGLLSGCEPARQTGQLVRHPAWTGASRAGAAVPGGLCPQRAGGGSGAVCGIAGARLPGLTGRVGLSGEAAGYHFFSLNSIETGGFSAGFCAFCGQFRSKGEDSDMEISEKSGVHQGIFTNLSYTVFLRIV